MFSKWASSSSGSVWKQKTMVENLCLVPWIPQARIEALYLSVGLDVRNKSSRSNIR